MNEAMDASNCAPGLMAMLVNCYNAHIHFGFPLVPVLGLHMMALKKT